MHQCHLCKNREKNCNGVLGLNLFLFLTLKTIRELLKRLYTTANPVHPLVWFSVVILLLSSTSDIIIIVVQKPESRDQRNGLTRHA
jgi:hypothetical protein